MRKIFLERLENRVLFSGVNTMGTFFLVNADTNTDIMPIVDGQTIDLSTLPTKNLNAKYVPSTTSKVFSVVPFFDGKVSTSIQGEKPYSMFGDLHGAYFSNTITEGMHTFSAKVFSGWATNLIEDSGTIEFFVVNSETTMQTEEVIIKANSSLHLRADDIVVSDQDQARYHWIINDDPSLVNDYKILEGYNVAHFYTKSGIYTVDLVVNDVNGKIIKKRWSVTVLEDTRQVVHVSTLDELKLNMKAGNRRIVVDSDLTFTYSIDGGSNVEVDFGTHVITVVGLNGSIMSGQTNFVVKNGSYVDANRNSRPARFWGPGGVLIGMTLVKAFEGLNGNNFPDKVLMQDVKTVDETSLSGDLAWMQGSNWVLLGNVCANSKNGQIVRSGGTTRFNLSYNDLENLDRRPTDPIDIAKQTLAIHRDAYATVYKNKLRGGRLEIGILGGRDGVTAVDHATVRMRHTQVIGNVMDFTLYTANRFEVRYGTEGLLITGNEITVKTMSAIQLLGSAEAVDPVYAPQYPGATIKNVYITADNVLKSLDGNKNLINIGPGCVNINNAWHI
jgi:hypothetical protein